MGCSHRTELSCRKSAWGTGQPASSCRSPGCREGLAGPAEAKGPRSPTKRAGTQQGRGQVGQVSSESQGGGSLQELLSKHGVFLTLCCFPAHSVRFP